MGIDFIIIQRNEGRNDSRKRIHNVFREEKGVKCICPVVYTNYSRYLDQENNVGTKKKIEVREKEGDNLHNL